MPVRLVYPGLFLREFQGRPSLKLGAYLRKIDSKRELRSGVIGAYKEGSDGVIPRTGPYIPRLNDDVVGIVISEEPTYLRVDIRSPYSAHFRPRDDEYYPIGTVIRASIVEFDLKRNPVLVATGKDYGPIEDGILVEFSPNKIGAVLGPKMSYLKKIQEALGVKIYPGRNGRFVIQGPKEAARRVAEFLYEVDRAPVTAVLSVVKRFLNSLRVLFAHVEYQG